MSKAKIENGDVVARKISKQERLAINSLRNINFPTKLDRQIAITKFTDLFETIIKFHTEIKHLKQVQYKLIKIFIDSLERNKQNDR